MLAMLRKLLHSAATIVVFAALTAIVLQILCTEAYIDSGILILKFNFADKLTDVLPSPTYTLHDRDLLEDFQDGAKSALNAAATRVVDAAGEAGSAISSAVSQVESTISSAAATVQNIEDIVPQNCSLGTRRFCIGYKQDINCSDLPLNFSSLLPEGVQKLPGPVQDALHGRAEALSQLVKDSTRFPAFSFPDALICGLALMSIIAILSLSLALRQPQVVTRVVRKLKAAPRSLALLALGLLCCSPFILIGVIFRTIRNGADKLPSWVEVDVGEVYGLGFAALTCSLVLALIFPTAPSVTVHANSEDVKGNE